MPSSTTLSMEQLTSPRTHTPTTSTVVSLLASFFLPTPTKGGGLLSRLVSLLPRVSVLVVLAWALYHFLFLRRKPKLYYVRTDRNERLVRGCPSLFRPYSPPVWLVNPHLQLLVAFVRNSVQRMRWTREHLTLQDGGTVSLDWAADGEDAERPSGMSCV